VFDVGQCLSGRVDQDSKTLRRISRSTNQKSVSCIAEETDPGMLSMRRHVQRRNALKRLAPDAVKQDMTGLVIMVA
jgi:hypothetical protein